jgi:hypothetical protein
MSKDLQQIFRKYLAGLSQERRPALPQASCSTAVYIDKNRLFKMLEQIVFKGSNR